MPRIPPSYCILVAFGCTSASGPATSPADQCTVQGTLWNVTASRTEWTTDELDADGQAVHSVAWDDEARSRAAEETYNTYDAGFLILSEIDADGDGAIDGGYRWERDDNGNVLAYELFLIDTTGESVVSQRTTYSYEDGLLVTVEEDGDADGTPEERDEYSYEGSRAVREDVFYEDSSYWVTWTYAAPAPALDHLEQQWSPEGDVTMTCARAFDAGEHMLTSDLLYVYTNMRYVITNTWDGDFLMVTESTEPQSEDLEVFVYDEQGRVVGRRYERDVAGDGVIDQLNQDSWEWPCP